MCLHLFPTRQGCQNNYLYRVFLLTYVLANVQFAASQSSIPGIEIAVNYGIQHQDTQYRNLQNDNSPWGIYQYGIGARKTIWQQSSFRLYGQAGYSHIKYTNPAPYNHCLNPLFSRGCDNALHYFERYAIDLIPITGGLEYQPLKGLLIGFDINIQWYFHKTIVERGIKVPYHQVGLYAIEHLLNIGYRWRRLSTKLHYRLWQLKSPDKVLFYSSNNRRGFQQVLNGLEVDNPTSLALSLAWAINN